MNSEEQCCKEKCGALEKCAALMYYCFMEKSVLDIENLRLALVSLKKAYDVFRVGNDDEEICKIYSDSCVKRFEYTFETAWKFMKKYFKLQYNKTDEELTMNNIFRFMEAYGFAPSWLAWKNYYEKRNNTAHEYNLNKSNDLIEIIPAFIEDVNYLLKKWESL